MQHPVDIQQAATPGLLRRLGAILYDVLLLTAILVMAVALVTIPLGMGLGIELDATHPLFRAYLVLISMGFFLWFWTHGGQTLGMKAWRIRVISDDGLPLTATNASLRYLCALLSWAACGLG
jgi:uncharacterized RDD family membrane protein YckC